MMIKATAFPTLAMLLCVPAAAHAQESLGGWRGLNVSTLDTIYVTDDTGRQTEGKLLRLEPESVVMLVEGAEQRFDAAHVRRIDRRGDSLKNGALIGAGFGVAFGILAALGSDCPEDFGGSCPGTRATFFTLSAIAYTGLGAGIDAMIVGRTRMFDAGRQAARRGISAGPQLAFRITW
jgi:hypothetical protein